MTLEEELAMEYYYFLRREQTIGILMPNWDDVAPQMKQAYIEGFRYLLDRGFIARPRANEVSKPFRVDL